MRRGFSRRSYATDSQAFISTLVRANSRPRGPSLGINQPGRTQLGIERSGNPRRDPCPLRAGTGRRQRRAHHPLKRPKMQLVGASAISGPSMHLYFERRLIRRYELTSTAASLGIVSPRDTPIGTRIARNAGAKAGFELGSATAVGIKNLCAAQSRHQSSELCTRKTCRVCSDPARARSQQRRLKMPADTSVIGARRSTIAGWLTRSRRAELLSSSAVPTRAGKASDMIDSS